MIPNGSGLDRGRRVLVAGGACEVGLAVGRSFVGQGDRVAILDLSPPDVHDTAKRVGRGAVGIVADVCDSSAIRRALADLYARWGGLDVLVYAVSFLGQEKSISLDMAVWSQVVDVNTRGAVITCREGLRALRAGASVGVRSRGRIVLLASAAACDAETGLRPSLVLKLVLAQVERVLGAELEAVGIPVSVVVPPDDRHSAQTREPHTPPKLQSLGDSGFAVRNWMLPRRRSCSSEIADAVSALCVQEVGAAQTGRAFVD